MAICQHCENTWSYKGSLKQILKFRRKMTCEHCKHHQYYSQNSYWAMQMIMVPAYFILIPLLNIVLDVQFLLGLLIVTLLLVIYFLLTPKFLSLSNKEEPLW
ncbi:TIGR04104 family putative zinc finger protein [Alkalibacillus silvisoli]|uniref:TIGR04104 family putative zinc finger protein n=1 Tax=Alkalibacillus silvisoli TaxID=392823 RepID=UPI0031D00482